MQHLAWSDVELLLVVSRTSSLRSASSRLGYDVSTVSRKLAALEERVGARLFDRSRLGIVATPLAQELRAHAEAMERAALDLERHIEGFEKRVEGTVRVSVPPSIGDLFLPELLTGLAETHPALDLVIEVSNALADIEQRDADLAIRLVRPAHGALTTRLLARLPHRALAQPEVARALGAIREWSQVPWVVAETGPLARAVEGVAPSRVRWTTDSIPAQLGAVRAGLGVAVLPAFFAPRFGLRALRGTRASPEPVWPEAELWMVGHVAQRSVPRIQAVAQWLASKVASVVAANHVGST